MSEIKGTMESQTLSQPGRFEFRFRWDRAEHRRLYRAMQREVRRGSKVRFLLNAWFAFIAAVALLALIGGRDASSRLSSIVPLAIVAAWFGFDRWGLAFLSARSYERDHAPCIPNDQIRILDGDGIAAECTTSNVSVRWDGIVKVHETPEFFLFFTTPACAIQLPTRAVRDPQQLRAWLTHMAENKRLTNTPLQADERREFPR